MSKLQIVTDSCANLSHDVIEKLGLHVLSLAYIVDGVERPAYVKGEKFDFDKFYSVIKSKTPASTSQVTPEQTKQMVRPILEAGDDVLYVGFSSALSGTFNAVRVAFEELKEEFPDRCLCAFDTMGATLGVGRFVLKAASMRDEGKSCKEIMAWLESNVQKLLHYFTVDDLFYLKRGGRLSAAKAIIGSALNVKPLLTMTSEGKLAPFGKAKGRKKAIDALVDTLEFMDRELSENTVYLVHSDAAADAEYAANQIKEKYSGINVEYTALEPIVGTHTGPGVMAVLFMGNKERDK